jgi:hypothetical protein
MSWETKTTRGRCGFLFGQVEWVAEAQYPNYRVD